MCVFLLLPFYFGDSLIASILQFEIKMMSQLRQRMKSQDVVVLLKIIARDNDDWYHYTIAKELHMSQSEVTQALKRSFYSGLLDASKKKVSKSHLLKFIEHGIKYVFPIQPGNLVKGIPTAYSAPILNKEINSKEQYVWPYAKGKAKGHSILPLYDSVKKAVATDQKLYEFLALIDIVRIGNTKEKKSAINLLKEK